MLAVGSFAKVFLVRSHATGRHFAMKALRKADVVAANQLEHVRAERALLASVDSPFIVKLHATFVDARKIYFLLDFVPGGDLFFLLRRTRRFPERVARFYAVEIVCALE